MSKCSITYTHLYTIKHTRLLCMEYHNKAQEKSFDVMVFVFDVADLQDIVPHELRISIINHLEGQLLQVVPLEIPLNISRSDLQNPHS